jgi:hypothetical protein
MRAVHRPAADCALDISCAVAILAIGIYQELHINLRLACGDSVTLCYSRQELNCIQLKNKLNVYIIREDDMKTAQEIVNICGGTSATARSVGICSQAVSNWIRRGDSVPLTRATSIIIAARDRGVEISLEDLID